MCSFIIHSHRTFTGRCVSRCEEVPGWLMNCVASPQTCADTRAR